MARIHLNVMPENITIIMTTVCINPTDRREATVPRWKLALIIFAVMTSIGGASDVQHLVQNTLPLQGGEPFKRNVLPDTPPNGFYAWCSTSYGICLVQGNGPIAPRLPCYCSRYAGITVLL